MQVLRKVERAKALLASGSYAQLLERLSEQVIPVGNPVFYWDRFVIVELAEPRRIVGGADVFPATDQDVQRLCAQHPDEAARFTKRIADGQRCLVIRDGDMIAARAWVIPQRPCYCSNSAYPFHPPHQPSIWCHDIHVERPYRRRGYFGALMEAARRLETRDRPPRLYAEIHFLNEASIRAHESFGYEIIRDVVVLSWLGLKTYVVTDERGRRWLDYRYALKVQHN